MTTALYSVIGWNGMIKTDKKAQTRKTGSDRVWMEKRYKVGLS